MPNEEITVEPFLREPSGRLLPHPFRAPVTIRADAVRLERRLNLLTTGADTEQLDRTTWGVCEVRITLQGQPHEWWEVAGSGVDVGSTAGSFEFVPIVVKE